MPTAPRRPGPPRGTVLAEVAVAATVLTVGVLGAASLLTAAARDATRARARHAAVALLATRAERWRAARCGASAGEQRAGALVERWRVTSNGTLTTLADTVTLEATSPRGAGPQRTGVVAVTRCTP